MALTFMDILFYTKYSKHEKIVHNANGIMPDDTS